jgi:hypothetical protein
MSYPADDLSKRKRRAAILAYRGQRLLAIQCSTKISICSRTSSSGGNLKQGHLSRVVAPGLASSDRRCTHAERRQLEYNHLLQPDHLSPEEALDRPSFGSCYGRHGRCVWNASAINSCTVGGAPWFPPLAQARFSLLLDRERDSHAAFVSESRDE